MSKSSTPDGNISLSNDPSDRSIKSPDYDKFDGGSLLDSLKQHLGAREEFLRKHAERHYQAEYYARNRERIAANKAEYYARNRERIAANQAEYRARNRERIAANKAEYRARNRERIAANQAEYRARNRERIAANQAEKVAATAARVLVLESGRFLVIHDEPHVGFHL